MTAYHQPRGDVAVLVAAAGRGERLGPGAPKALRDLRGEPLLVHALRRLAAAPSVAHIVIAAPPGAEHAVAALAAHALAGTGSGSGSATDGGTDSEASRGEGAGGQAAGGSGGSLRVVVEVVTGEATRQGSVGVALGAVPEGIDIVLVHDAARALAPVELIERVAAEVRDGHDAVVPVLPVVDTLKQVDDAGVVLATVDRTVLRAVQTPQGFRRAVLVAAHANAATADSTDDAGLVEKLGVPVWTVPGSEQALKITRPSDLIIAEALFGGPRQA